MAARRAATTIWTVALLGWACAPSLVGPVAAAPPPAAPSTTAIAESVFSRFQADCKADNGRLWGAKLCGPFLLVSEDGQVFANQPDPEGRLRPAGPIWTGQFPEDSRPVYSDTSAEWAGRRWAIARLQPSRSPLDYARLALHESFHRIQPDLPFSSANTDSADHLDDLEGRLWMRLSLRALAAALAAPDERQARDHVRAALLMSRHRHRLIPGAEQAERALELHEGLAEYTGWRLARTEGVEREFADHLAEGDKTESFARSFPYLTGPAWGLAFDRLSIPWRPRLAAEGPGLVAIGLEALRLGGSADERAAMAAARTYGYDALLAEEQQRSERLRLKRAEYHARFVAGPRLVVPLNQVSFDPRTVTPLGEHGQVYGTLMAHGPWGRLRTEQGALVNWKRREVTVGAEGDPLRPVGETARWRLELDSGWELVRRGDDLVVEQSGAQ